MAGYTFIGGEFYQLYQHSHTINPYSLRLMYLTSSPIQQNEICKLVYNREPFTLKASQFFCGFEPQRIRTHKLDFRFVENGTPSSSLSKDICDPTPIFSSVACGTGLSLSLSLQISSGLLIRCWESVYVHFFHSLDSGIVYSINLIHHFCCD